MFGDLSEEEVEDLLTQVKQKIKTTCGFDLE
jgi:hypothetical protein